MSDGGRLPGQPLLGSGECRMWHGPCRQQQAMDKWRPVSALVC